MTAGMAAKRPIAVAIRASEIPGATVASVAWTTRQIIHSLMPEFVEDWHDDTDSVVMAPPEDVYAGTGLLLTVVQLLHVGMVVWPKDRKSVV